MTEEEKRRLAQQIFAAEQARLNSYSPLDAAHADLSASLRRSEERRKTYAALEQQGHTWQELHDAYNAAYEEGKRALIIFHLTFFYCSLAIALKEAFDLIPTAIKTFISKVESMMNNATSRDSVVGECLEKTGIDTSYADIPAVPDKSTRKDRAAINRMMRSGITARDLDRERETGYYMGRHSGFFLSAGYAGVALLLALPNSPASSELADGKETVVRLTRPEIESFLERISDITDEEISVADILERAKEEAHVDASEIASEKSYKF